MKRGKNIFAFLMFPPDLNGYSPAFVPFPFKGIDNYFDHYNKLQ
jgi:hypothetical protein